MMPALAETCSDAARRRFLAGEGIPLFVADWTDVVFIHYAVEPDRLQPHVPFPLETFEGEAYVSLVAFSLERMRNPRWPRLTRGLLRPISEHGFLNVRTYVRRNDEPGIYFLAEWLSNPLSIPLGPPLFGLPYRFGQLEYANPELTGRVTASGGALRYRGKWLDRVETPAGPDSLEAFLLERYTAFTRWGSWERFFRIWHPPWPARAVEIDVSDDTLVATTGNWWRNARRAGAHYSPGVKDVWMGKPQWLPHCFSPSFEETESPVTCEIPRSTRDDNARCEL